MDWFTLPANVIEDAARASGHGHHCRAEEWKTNSGSGLPAYDASIEVPEVVIETSWPSKPTRCSTEWTDDCLPRC